MPKFDQKPHQKGVLQKYERLEWAQRTSVAKFLSSIDAVERDMRASAFAEHPEAARAIKLLDGCKTVRRASRRS